MRRRCWPAGLLVLCACPGERRAPPNDTAAAVRADSPAPPPTVRRAPRARAPQRAASALHVLGAPAPARNALEPLDAPLRVEVFDLRGRAAAGARVEWRVVRGGGRVAPAAAITDSAGVAAATWTPGPTADLQVVSVGVPGVGSVELQTRVPAGGVTVQPASPSLWPGDSLTLRADLSDSAGHALSGGTARWESTDTSTARVTAEGVVVGVRAGVARIVARADSARGSGTVTVLPAVAGRLFVANGLQPPAARLVVRSPRRTDSLEVAPGASFGIRLTTTTLYDSVEVEVRPDDARHRPATLRTDTPRELGELRLVLLPVTWTITGGSFAGRTVVVSPSAPLTRARDGARFWRLERAEPRTTWVPAGWDASRLPVPVAFQAGPTGVRVSPADSAAFWLVARTVERDLDARLFAPATDPPGEEELRGAIHVLVDPGLSDPGFTVTTWGGMGSIIGSTVAVRSAALLSDRRVMTHELLHAIGFGHTSSWPSVMAPHGGGTGALTVEDAAYAQLLLRLRRVQGANGAPYGVVEAAAAERGGAWLQSLPELRDRARIP